MTRGNDLFAAAHVQRLLQALLGLPAPVYAHHRLILDAAGRNFQTRQGRDVARSARERRNRPQHPRQARAVDHSVIGVLPRPWHVGPGLGEDNMGLGKIVFGPALLASGIALAGPKEDMMATDRAFAAMSLEKGAARRVPG